jgi:hypothetical protein
MPRATPHSHFHSSHTQQPALILRCTQCRGSPAGCGIVDRVCLGGGPHVARALSISVTTLDYQWQGPSKGRPTCRARSAASTRTTTRRPTARGRCPSAGCRSGTGSAATTSAPWSPSHPEGSRSAGCSAVTAPWKCASVPLSTETRRSCAWLPNTDTASYSACQTLNPKHSVLLRMPNRTSCPQQRRL